MIHPIIKYPDPVLRESFVPVEQFDAELKQLAQDMLDTMNDAEGIGLAAQQIGKTLGICVVDVPEDHDQDAEDGRLNPDIEMPLVLVNPTIVELEGPVTPYEEGCLSFPGLTGKVDRPDEVDLAFQDLDGREHRLKARGLVGRCIQHEIDHLNGVLFIDRLSPVKKVAIAGKLKKMKREFAG